MNASDFYRAIYRTLWRLNERHDLRSCKRAANDGDAWSPLGGAA